MSVTLAKADRLYPHHTTAELCDLVARWAAVPSTGDQAGPRRRALAALRLELSHRATLNRR